MGSGRNATAGRGAAAQPRRGRFCPELLAELRARAVDAVEDEVLVADHAPASIADLPRSLDEFNQTLASIDVSEADGRELMATALALEDAQRRLDGAKALVMGALDRSGAAEAASGLTARNWKALRTKGSERTFGRELRAARTMERFDEVAQALRRGDLSVDHVLAVSSISNERIVDELVEHQGHIVRMARLYPFRRFTRFLRRLAAALDQDGSQPDCGDRDTASLARDFEGHLHVRLELSGHNAVGAQRIINEETERQRRAAQRESESTGAPVPEAPVLRARAVMELLRRGAHANPQSPRPAVEAILPITVDRHGRPTSVQSVDGHSLDEFTAAPLICDAILQPVITDTSGAPLRLGRATRLFTKPQRVALVTRDGGCVFPGCDQPASRCDAHHEHPWELGGRTDVDNGCLLCRRHHGLVHCSNPWVLQHLQVDELPPELAESHWARATSAGLDPPRTVRVWRSPDGRLHLAQNAADRAGPAPPRRAAA